MTTEPTGPELAAVYRELTLIRPNLRGHITEGELTGVWRSLEVMNIDRLQQIRDDFRANRPDLWSVEDIWAAAVWKRQHTESIQRAQDRFRVLERTFP